MLGRLVQAAATPTQCLAELSEETLCLIVKSMSSQTPP